MVTNSARLEHAAPARPGKRERLVAVASELIYRQGVAHTTLADISQAAGMLVGNLYYYFKTKDDIVAAVVQAHQEQLQATLAELDRRHRSPQARLKALVDLLASRADATAEHGCPYGSLSAELAKQAEGSDPLSAPLMQTMLDWAERHFRAIGRRDARDLAVELVACYEGTAVLVNTLGQPELMARQARRLRKWIDAVGA